MFCVSDFCLCMLAFRVLTLGYFYLCVRWHFFILVPPVMDDGSCRWCHHWARPNWGIDPWAVTVLSMLCCLSVLCTAHQPIFTLPHHYHLDSSSWFSVHYAIKHASSPIRKRDGMLVMARRWGPEARVSDMSRGKEMRTKNRHIQLPL